MVFGLFSKERSLKRAIAKVANKYAQSVDRYAAMEKLSDIGTDEAMMALLKRFSFSYDKTIEDEQEKQWLYESLCTKGEQVLKPLHLYMKSADSVAYPLRVLERIVRADRALEVIDDLLSNEDPGYTRDPTRRIQIIDWLADYTDATDEQVATRVAPYIADFDENCRFSAIEACSLRPCDSTAEPLVDALLDEDEESKRVKLRVAEVLAEQKMDLGGRKHEVAALIDDLLSDYKIQYDKLVKK